MKRMLKIILQWIFPALKKGASVLMYHSIGYNGAFFTVTPENFERQMAYLARRNYMVVPLSELVKKYEKGEDVSSHVALTFDDAYADVLEYALPVLSRHGFRASMFVPTSLLGQIYTTSDKHSLQIFSLDQYRMAEAGVFELLPHTATHRELPSLSVSDIRYELRESHAFLDAIGGTENILAYPRGKYSPLVEEVLADEGWKAAVTTLLGLLTTQTSRFRMPRNFVGRETTLPEFRALVSDGIHYYAKIRTCFSGLFRKS